MLNIKLEQKWSRADQSCLQTLKKHKALWKAFPRLPRFQNQTWRLLGKRLLWLWPTFYSHIANPKSQIFNIKPQSPHPKSHSQKPNSPTHTKHTHTKTHEPPNTHRYTHKTHKKKTHTHKHTHTRNNMKARSVKQDSKMAWQRSKALSKKIACATSAWADAINHAYQPGRQKLNARVYMK